MRINHKVAMEIGSFVSAIQELGETPKELLTFKPEVTFIPGDDAPHYSAVVPMDNLNLSQDAIRIIEKLGVSRACVQGQSQFVIHSDRLILPHQHRFIAGREKVAEDPSKVLSSLAYNLRLLKSEANAACGEKVTVASLAKKLDVRLVLDRCLGKKAEATIEVANSKQALNFIKESNPVTVNALDDEGVIHKLLISPSSIAVGSGKTDLNINRGDLLDTASFGKPTLKVIPYAQFENEFTLCNKSGERYAQTQLNGLHHVVTGLAIGHKAARALLKSTAAHSNLAGDADFNRSEEGKVNIVRKALDRLEDGAFKTLIRRPVNLYEASNNLDDEEAAVVKAAKWLHMRSTATEDIHPLVSAAKKIERQAEVNHSSSNTPKTFQQLRV